MDLGAQNAFDSLKQAFITAPMLLHADPTKPFQVETDASDFAIDAILSQADDTNLMHQMAYYSRKFMASEIIIPFTTRISLLSLLSLKNGDLTWPTHNTVSR